MKRILTLIILICACYQQAKADHITGGQIYYTSKAGQNGNIVYSITYKLYMRCFSNRQFNDPTIVSVFNKTTHDRISNNSVNLTRTENISITNPDPCITNPPDVCYVVGYYQFELTLPPSKDGYILSTQVNYRIAGIANLENGYSNIGATYTAEIPGNLQNAAAPLNNSAQFIGSDLVVVCANNRFSYSFAAQDADGDLLRYSFCDAYRSSSGGNMVIPTPNPPYARVPYGNGFNSDAPMGVAVSINSSTGLITGTAPREGIYVITVCVEEIRDGKVIATQRKDLQINVAACNKASAILQPDYMLCGDTKTLSIQNLSASPLIKTMNWEIATRNGSLLFTSTDALLTYTFADTGSYTIKLVINRNEACTDSTFSIVRVYPGFVPGFVFKGICFNKPTKFFDKTTTVYGKVSAWSWDFGSNEYSVIQNPEVTYESQGIRNVQLVVENSVGCRDTIAQQVNIVTSPPLSVPFSDTLLCIGDSLMLHAQGSGIFSWTPTDHTINANTANPVVRPVANTIYTVEVNDNGCLNNATVMVRVTDHVSLQLMKDTTICQGDSIRLHLVSDAFKYSWFPVSQLNNASLPDPVAFTVSNTTYGVVASIGSCSATARVQVATVPYPKVFAGTDTILCFGTSAQLNGATDGFSINWSPNIFVSNPHIVNPVASPRQSTNFILTAFDNKGCPKPAFDTVLVQVLPDINADAGHDTAVVLNQPMQLNAKGGSIYLWSPTTGLSANNIANPVAVYNETFNSIRYKVMVSNEVGCTDSAFVTVKVFNTGPSIFVPTAFTPNADGKNDVLRPISAGISQIDYFQVFNRWGQLVFKTNKYGQGWDGTINGEPQPTGTYVWFVKATDYTGAPYTEKGTVVLIK